MQRSSIFACDLKFCAQLTKGQLIYVDVTSQGLHRVVGNVLLDMYIKDVLRCVLGNLPPASWHLENQRGCQWGNDEIMQLAMLL